MPFGRNKRRLFFQDLLTHSKQQKLSFDMWCAWQLRFQKRDKKVWQFHNRSTSLCTFGISFVSKENYCYFHSLIVQFLGLLAIASVLLFGIQIRCDNLQRSKRTLYCRFAVFCHLAFGYVNGGEN